MHFYADILYEVSHQYRHLSSGIEDFFAGYRDGQNQKKHSTSTLE